jgi:hypothetical protein
MDDATEKVGTRTDFNNRKKSEKVGTREAVAKRANGPELLGI